MASAPAAARHKAAMHDLESAQDPATVSTMLSLGPALAIEVREMMGETELQRLRVRRSSSETIPLKGTFVAWEGSVSAGAPAASTVHKARHDDNARHIFALNIGLRTWNNYVTFFAALGLVPALVKVEVCEKTPARDTSDGGQTT
ncbi:hypothetical protein T492DRAFT_856648 [Pavlovales sp. CCMP2436]|nr:hypothetical protein T492DRAFT_856648 [Pavlovales sp. CCMP2436]